MKMGIAARPGKRWAGHEVRREVVDYGESASGRDFAAQLTTFSP
jgi:hypothetical protein